MSKPKSIPDNMAIARKIAYRIDHETAGCEVSKGETEVLINGIYYRAEYIVRREFNEVFAGLDNEPDNRSKTFVTILGGNVYDADGNDVESTFDFTMVENFFDYDATIDYRDER